IAGGQRRSWLVDLGRDALRVGDRDIDTYERRDRNRARRDIARLQHRVVRVIGADRKHGQSLATGSGDDASDVHALASCILTYRGRGLRLAGAKAGVEGDRAIERGVGGEGDDHAAHTSTPASSRAAANAADGTASVTSTSM